MLMDAPSKSQILPISRIAGFVLLTIFCLLQPPILTGQGQDAGTQAVMAQFANPDKVLWTRYYRGRMDDLNDVSVILASDGEQCHGQLTYLRSRERIILSGKIYSDSLDLAEWNATKEQVAFIRGRIRQNQFKAEWSSLDKKRGAKLISWQTDKPSEVPAHCGDNKWFRIFSGSWIDSTASVFLQKEGQDRVHGMLYTHLPFASFQLEGILQDQDNLVLKTYDHFGKYVGQINGTIDQQDVLNAVWKPDAKASFPMQMNQRMQLAAGCFEFADFFSSYDLTYPKLRHAGFSAWLDQQLSDWKNQVTQYTREHKPSNRSASVRSMLRASAWTDLEFINDQIVSGVITSTYTWTQSPGGMAFVYDLKNNKPLLISEMVKDVGALQSLLKLQLSENLTQYAQHSDAAFDAWVVKQDFPSYTIRAEGICFSTLFHPLYGRVQVLLGWAKLQELLKPNTVVASLAKPKS